MDALLLITFLFGLAPLGNFTFSSTASFKGKQRPIYSMWDREEKEIPPGFYEVLMRIDSNSKTFTSADGRLQIAKPTEEEESVHDFQSLYDDGCSHFYFFFTKQELRDAGYNPTRSLGFNYWNPEAIRWELRGHVVEDSLAEHRFYNVEDGFVPVCYQFNDGNNTYQPRNQNFPVFTEDDMTSAWCFQPFFKNSSNNCRDAVFFIEFSDEELISLGVEVPENLTGFKFDHVSAQFEQVNRLTGEYHWDYVFQKWAAPFCASDDCRCDHGNLAFDWEQNSNLVLEQHPVCSYLARTVDEGVIESERSKPIMGLFSSQGGQYCDCNCYCSNCKKFYPPSNASMHKRHDDDSGWKCD